jgi:lysophospholipase L1-like esterase
MAAIAYLWSDPLAFALTPGAQVQVTIHFGTAPASGTYPGITVHRGSRTIPRVLAGNQVAARTFAGSTTTTQGQGSWVISSMEVRAPQSAGAVAILGNSITDGFGVTNDAFTRWTDALTTRLLAHARTSRVGVLNAGIGAGNLVSGGVSTPGLQRYKRDLFDHAGVKWVVLFIGVNDIGTTGCSMTTSNNAIAAFTTIADSARARGLKVYGATITPFNGNSYYSVNSEACRQTVNTWIRTTTKYDAVIDFDRIIRNPSDTSRILTTYNNDGLHPNIAGYAFMGNSVDTNLFIDSVTSVRGWGGSTAGHALEGIRFAGRDDVSIRFRIPRESFVSLKVYSPRGEIVAELGGRTFAPGGHAVELRTGNLANGVFLFSMKSGGFTATRGMVLSGR